MRRGSKPHGFYEAMKYANDECNYINIENSKRNKLVIVGQKIGRLTAIKYSHTKHNIYWQFECDCGKIVVSRVTLVLNGQTRSCGCLRRESARRIGL